MDVFKRVKVRRRESRGSLEAGVPTILVIEDADDVAQVICRELQASGYSVLHAEDGLTGLELDDRFDPDLIVLDSMLPQLDGLEILRRFRWSSDVPVLMLTARGEQVTRVSAPALRADDYLAKPINTSDLIARIDALLRRAGRTYELMASACCSHEPALNYGPLKLSLKTHLLSLDDIPLDLTLTESELLRLLMRNPGRALSRSSFLGVVWGETYVTGDRSVDSAVFRLRKKLDTLGDAIETVRGAGYRLRCCREQGPLAPPLPAIWSLAVRVSGMTPGEAPTRQAAISGTGMGCAPARQPELAAGSVMGVAFALRARWEV